jgi:hypothetical protein
VCSWRSSLSWVCIALFNCVSATETKNQKPKETKMKNEKKINALELKFEAIGFKIEAKENEITAMNEAGKGYSAKCQKLEDQLNDLHDQQYEIQNKIDELS